MSHARVGDRRRTEHQMVQPAQVPDVPQIRVVHAHSIQDQRPQVVRPKPRQSGQVRYVLIRHQADHSVRRNVDVASCRPQFHAAPRIVGGLRDADSAHAAVRGKVQCPAREGAERRRDWLLLGGLCRGGPCLRALAAGRGLASLAAGLFIRAGWGRRVHHLQDNPAFVETVADPESTVLQVFLSHRSQYECLNALGTCGLERDGSFTGRWIGLPRYSVDPHGSALEADHIARSYANVDSVAKLLR